MARILANAGYGGSDPFDIYKDFKCANKLDDLTKDDVLILHGGADISPIIYGQKGINQNEAHDVLSTRDRLEVNLIIQAWKLGIPIIGICRGAQLLCAMDGGTLVQHMYDHRNGHHTIVDLETGELHKATSAHHQMMVPTDKYGAKILATATSGTSGLDKEGNEMDIDIVPEVVHFPQLNAIGIQGHPEWVKGSPYNKYCGNLIKKYIL